MRFNIVKTGRWAAVVVGTALTATFAAAPASAEITGQLACNIAPSVGNLISSTRPVSCTFRSPGGPAQFYNGEISRLGVDIGQYGGGQLVYDAISLGNAVPGALQGSYVGVGGGLSLGTGIGVNALVGGSGNAITLQPLSTSTSTGTNLSAGLTSLKLAFAGLDQPPMGRHRRGIVARY